MSSIPLLAVLALFCATVSASAADKPNVLWLSTEDISPTLGCYGDGYAVTPNLDALAKKGMLFLHAWSNGPVCAPARTTVISGMYPPSTGSEHMRSSVPLPDGCRMFPQHLRDAGYYCTNNAKEDYNLQKAGMVWDESSKNAHWRKRKAGQPFFAVFNHEVTHESKVRAGGHKLVHDPAKAPVPAYHPDTPEVRHNWAQYYDNITTMDGQVAKPLQEIAEAGLAEDTVVFFWGDHGAGLPRSKRWPYNSGLQVPLIVYFPPKWQHLAPKGYQPGAKSEELVSFVDFAPTMLSLAGLKAPAHLQGRAFAGEHRKEAPGFLFGFRGRMDERCDLVRSATDGRYVYLRQYLPHLPYGQHVNYMFAMPTTQVWKKLFDEGKLNEAQARFWKTKPAEELYDLQSDRWEVNNLAGSKEHAPVLERMRRAQQEWCTSTRDLGFIPEAERLRIAAGKSPRDVFANDAAYPFAEVFAAAGAASDAQHQQAQPFVKLLTHPHAAVRWWGVIGLHIRGAQALAGEHEALSKLLVDESPSVRIAAAEALATHGSKDDLTEAVAVLLAAADTERLGNMTAVEALNALDRLSAKDATIKSKVAKLPGKATGADSRLREYVPRLREHVAR